VLVLNKIDLVAKAKLLPLMAAAQKWHDFVALVPVSATTGDGVEQLEKVLLEHLPEGEAGFPDDYLTDQPERVLVAETVREKVLQNTRAELPFSTAVVVDQFDEEERDRLLRLYCTIYVEHDSQKPIVIGRGGEMIKKIGTEARHDLEKFFEVKVFLDLRVKVNPTGGTTTGRWTTLAYRRPTASPLQASRQPEGKQGEEGEIGRDLPELSFLPGRIADSDRRGPPRRCGRGRPRRVLDAF